MRACRAAVLLITLGTLVTAPAVASEDTGVHREEPVIESAPRELLVGDLVPDLPFTDVDGETGSLWSLRGERGLVLVMRDADCPVGRRQGPSLARLEQDFTDQGLPFLWVYVSGLDDAQAVRDDREALGFSGRAVIDDDHDLARPLRVRSTTELFVLDAAATLRYRGAVDDQYGVGFERPAPRHTYAADALAALVEGRDVPVPATSAPGCLVELEGLDDGDELALPETVTYHGSISRLVQDRCLACHREGGVAPFALDDPEVLRRRGGMIEYVLDHRLMPPWGAVEGSGPWSNDNSLGPRDRALVAAWLAGDGPLGDPSHAPLPRSFSDTWAAGEPDLVVDIEPFTVPAEGQVDYQYSWQQLDLPEDRWVSAVEVLPGATQAVHHVLVFVEAPRQSGESGQDYNRRFQGGLQGYFAAFVPGSGLQGWGEGTAKFLPRDAWLKFQVHYTPGGVEVEDRTRVGFHFADGPPRHEVRTGALAQDRFRIPAGASDHAIEVSGTFGKTATLLGFSPHMHYRGKSFRYEVDFPDGTTRTVLDVPRYDFDWQTMYRLAEPLVLPPGSTLRCTAVYDNSEDNPANPDPTRTVSFGEQTWDEMMIGYFEWWPGE